MCDCFHMVLPTWPGAPGSVSGRQLQPEEPDAETEEDPSVTEGPVDEIIRPRPQGSSPVYEYTPEGASFRFPEDTPSRQGSSGRRRSWWKRDSGDSRTISRMSHSEEVTEVMLNTEVEAGASGYSVTGGGDQGIFVKQVLKDSSAAKLFSLREGDQLLSATIFFDNINYEDALKILQYSEPYKVQFKVKRKLSAQGDEVWASSAAQHALTRAGKQDKDVADGSTDTPMKTLERDGDQERLISKPREGRGRRPQKDRLSWPKFQAIKSRRGPRRSHSSSEAYEKGKAPDMSPTSSDTEAQFPAGASSRRRRRCPNLRFKMEQAEGRYGEEGKGLRHRPKITVDRENGRKTEGDISLGDKEVAARDSKFKMPKFKMPSFGASVPSKSIEASVDVPLPKVEADVSLPSVQADVKTRDLRIELPSADVDIKPGKLGVKLPEGHVPEGEPQGLTAGAGLKGHLPKVQMPSLKMPKVDLKGPQVDVKGPKLNQRGTKREVTTTEGEASLPGVEVDIQAPRAKLEGDTGLGDKEMAARDSKFKMPKFKMPSFGVSAPGKDWGTSVDVPMPKATGEATLPDLGGDVRAPEGRVQLTSAEIEVPGGELEVALPEGEVTLGELKGKAEGAGFKGRLPKVQMPSIKMPKVDIKGPQVDLKGPKLDLTGAKGEMSTRDVQLSLPSVEVDLQAPHDTLEGDIGLGDKEVAARDSKFKMPKFKMPSFGTLAPSKSIEASVDVSLPKVEADVSVPSVQADVMAPDLSIKLPSADVDIMTGELSLELLEGQMPEGELQGPTAGAGLKGHLPKVPMPSVKMPKVDLKGPQVDFKGPQVDIKGPKMDLRGVKGKVTTPDVEASLPGVEVDIQTPGTKLEGDIGLGDKEVAARDSKFKMPKFKMPSFGMSAPGKDWGTSVDGPGGEVRAPEGSVQLTSAEIEVPGGELEVALPEGEVTLGELKGKAEGAGFKGRLPKVQMPSIKMPKVDIKGPQVDIKGPKVDLKGPQVDIKGHQLDLSGATGKVTALEVEASLPGVEVDIQAPGDTLEGDISLGDKEVAARDSKFKMPKFKMPSFGTSAPSKSIEASVDVSLPKVEADVSVPSVQADVKAPDLSIKLPSADVDIMTGELGLKLPEGEMPEGQLQGPTTGAGLKGQLPKVQMPSLKMPKVDLKGSQVDFKGPKMDLRGAKGKVTVPDVEVLLPGVEVDIQAPGAKLEGDFGMGDKEVAARDSKFKMPKFKMPSFGVSAPSKGWGTSVDVPMPKATGEATLPDLGGDVRAPEGSVQLTSAEIEVPGGELEVALPEGEVTLGEMKGKAEGVGFKGHLPKVQMPSIKMPKVDIKGPQVDIKGPKVDLKGPEVDIKGHKLDLRGNMGEVTSPDMEASLTGVEMDLQAGGVKLEGDISLGDKELATRESNLKMPQFKMPSFGVSAPDKDWGTSVDGPGGEVQAPEGSVQLASAEIKLPGGELKGKTEGAGFKGRLPKVQMPSIKMPKVDIKDPQVDIKSPKLDLKGAKEEMSTPDVQVTLPSMKLDQQAPDATLEGDISLGDKEVAARDSKFKMPQFKMPSFGVSIPSKSIDASVDVTRPKVEADVALPSFEADVKTCDLSIELPSADVDIKTRELDVNFPEGNVPEEQLQGPTTGAGLKGHLPKVQMPSLRMPKVDLKGPQVDIKGQKLDLSGTTGEVTAPNVEALLSGVEVDIQTPGTKLEGDIGLGDKEVAARDSKFKMPKFKMPSFGVSAPGKDWGTSVDVPMPKATGEATLPSLGGEMRAPEGSIQLTSAEIEVPGGELEVALPEGEVTLGELKGKAEGAGFKGRLPKVQMPSIKMPKVDIKGPQVDLKGPKLDLMGAKGEMSTPDVQVSLPSVKLDHQAPDAALEGDIGLGDKEVAARDSKFKMPKFKMPSFGTSTPSKSIEVSVDVSLPKGKVDVSLPPVHSDVKAPDLSIELPSADVDITTGELGLKLPEGHLPEGELHGPTSRAGLKGHLPKVQMPSLKMPQVDLKSPQVEFKGPQVDIKGHKLDLRVATGEVTAPDVEASLPAVEVDRQTSGTSLEGDIDLGEKEVASRESKFKTPKFKMPSFGTSTPSKSIKASVDVSLPKFETDVSLPSVPADVKAPDLSIELPSADRDVKTGELNMKLAEGHLPEGQLQGPTAGAGLKGQLPKVQMPSLKMPKIDLKGPQVDIKGPKLDLRDTKGKVTTPDVEASLPGVEMDIQALDAKLEGDIGLGDKEVAARESKIKMPKFKMPSMSAQGRDWGTSVDMPMPKATGEATLPSLGGEMRAPEGSVQLASAEIEVPGGELEVALPEGEVTLGELKGKAEGAGFKGRLPKVQMPSIKMPKVDIKGPQVDIKGPKLDLTGAKGEMSTPDMQLSLPSVELDHQALDAALEGDISLGDREVAARDSKFKMPQFKMPSFGASIPSKSIEASVDMSLPKVKADVALPPVEADVKTHDLSIKLPSADVDIKTRELGVKLPEGHVPEEQLQGPTTGAGLKGHLPKVQMPSLRMPKVDLKGPQVDIKGQKLDLSGTTGEVTAPNVEASLSGVEVDIQTPGTKLEGDIGLGDKEVAARDSKFKMPKFKMPSFGVSAPGKDWGTSVDVPMPKATGEATLPSLGGEVRAPEGSVQLTSAEIEVPGGELEVALPEGEVTLGELKGKAEGSGFKGRLPKVQMPSIKMPKVDIKGPQVDLKGPKLDLMGAKGEMSTPDVQVSLPSVKLDHQAPDAALEGDISLGDKEVAARDSKFKMPQFKMPSLGTSVPSKSMEVSEDVSLSKVKADISMPSVQADVKTHDLSTELPSADVDIHTGELGVKLSEHHLPKGELQGPTSGAGLKGHLPKVQMPSLKMPKIDLKGAHVDIKGPKLDLRGAKGEVTAPDVEASLPGMMVDLQAPGANQEGDIGLGEKELTAGDSKFKMPKFKMPSFGVSAPSKSIKASVDVSLPKVEVDVSPPSVPVDVEASDLSIELPSADVDVKTGELNMKLLEGHLPEGQLQGPTTGAGLKGQLPKVQMPSLKMPKIDLKGPQVDIKGPKLDVRGAKGEVTAAEVEVSLPGLEVDIQAQGAKLEGDIGMGGKEVVARDSKFKMPQFKMPSFDKSVPSMSTDASVDMSLPKVEVDVSLPSVEADVKTRDLSIKLPSADVDVKRGELGVKLLEGYVPEEELQGPTAGAGLKGHLPKVQMPSLKMPKVDLKGAQVDIKGPKMDLRGAKGKVIVPDVEALLPGVEVDIQAPGAKLEGHISLGDKEVAARDSKFKMPKFKMPSFGTSAPGKDWGTSVDVSMPKATGEATLPSLGGEVRAPEGSVQLTSAEIEVPGGELEVALPEGEVSLGELKGKAEGARFKGHLPKVQMPSIKMPKVDIKGPQVDIKRPKVDLKGPQVAIKGPQLDLRGAKGKVTTTDVEASLPSVEVDLQAPGANLQSDIGLDEKEVATRDSKFKMPKLKMPSFGASAPSKSIEASVDVSLTKGEVDVSLPSVKADVKTSDLSIELPSADMDVKPGRLGVKLPEGHIPEGELQGSIAGLKGSLPKVQMPSLKMPKVDLKGPQVDIKGPQLDLTGAKGEVTTTDVEALLPSVQVDIQVPGAKMEGDIGLGDKEMAARDSKFKMPKFKMPSFGMSAPDKDWGTSVDMPVPKATGEATLPSLGGEVRAPEGSVQLTSAEIEVPGGELEVALPEGEVTLGELKGKAEGAGFKGRLPKVQMPSIKMPKVDIKGPQVDIKGPKLDLKGAKGEMSTPDVQVSLPSVKLDHQAPDAALEGDIGLGDKEVAARDSKFKMPKFKMPSFGASAPSKSIKASVDVSLPKGKVDVSLSSVPADAKAPDLSIELPSADVGITTRELGVKLPEGHQPEEHLQGPTAGAGLKGHLPKVQMPSLKMPKVDLKGAQVDIKGPKLDLRGAKGEVTTPDMEVLLPGVEVDIQAQGAKLEGDIGVGDKEVATRDSKFKMPKFKMPSFSASGPSKSIDASMDVSLPKVEADIKTSKLRTELPSVNVDVQTGELGVKLLEGHLHEGELYGPTTGAGLKGHLPKVQMPSLKMPKVDLKGPQVDIKGPKMDLRGIKGEVTTPHVEASLPGVEVDIQALDAKLEGDIGLGDKEVAARDRKFKMPKFKMPSFGVSAPGKDWGTSVDVSVPKATGEATLLSLGGDVRAPEGSVQLTSAEIEVPGGELEVALPKGEVSLGELKGKAEGSGFKGRLPKVQMPSIKMPKVDLKGPKLDLRGAKSEFSAPGVEASLPGVQVDLQAADATLEGDFDVEFSDGTVSGSRFQMPCTRTSSHTQPSVPSTRFDGSGYHAEASCEGVTLTKYQVTLPRATVPPELPQETPFEGKGDAPLFNPQCTEDLPSSERVPLSQIDGHPVPVDPLIRTSYGQLTFPKFHLPKFSISASEAAEAVGETCAAGGALSPPSPEGSLDSKEAPVFPSGAQLPSGSVPTSKGMEDPVGRVRTSAVAPDGGPAEDTDHDGKGSPLKLPRLRLPSFRRSPKKGAELQGDPGLSLVVDSGAPGVHVPQVEAHVDVTTEKDGGKGRVKMPGFAMPKLALPKLKASKGGVGLPPGDTEPAFSGSSVAVTSLATVGASGKGVAGGTGTTSGAPEGEDTNLHLSQVPLSSAGFAKPDLGPIQAQAEASQSMGDLPLGDGSKGHGLGDGSASQWHEEVVASSTEDPLQATCRAPDPAAPTAGSPEGDSAGRGVPASSQDSWFRMPSLRLPSFWRSSKERGGDVGLGAQVQVPVSSAPGEGEVPATVRSCAPVSEVAAALPLPPPEAEADVAEVLRPSLDSKGLKLHLPPTGMSPHDLSTSEARPGPGEGSLPLQTPGGRLSETRAPPEEPGQTPAGSAERTEPWSSPLEGPLTLKASQTEELAQISVIDMGQLWQDSVLTVRFPTLKVPRFTFPAPSSEADVFIPTTREVWCPDSSIDLALYKESPGVWGTSILKAGAGVPWERPVALDISDAPPISKVRVHIQGAQVETQEVTIHSRVTTEFADVSGRETVSTQIVRESEIPASEIQTPSYGFSLLKGKVAEGPLRAQVHMVTQDSQLQEGLQVSSKHVAPVPGDLQPDTGEPFEIITPSVHVPGPQTTFEVRPGSQFADSCSDEEPAEILEFPPEDSRGEGSATEDKPESKRSSGRFRFWLPSIGFASSAEDASADSTGDTQTPAPIRTQPEALPPAELPKKPEKAGWFRFPKLGFSSLPSKKSESPGDPACLTESKPQEEAVTFFDAQESFYTEEQEEGEPAEAASARPGPSAMATSSVTRGLGRPEQGRHTSAEPAPRPATK